MKLATILPTKYLSYSKESDYHMALAHLVAEDKEYTEHFKGLDKDKNYVILDNSVIEDAQQTIEEVCRKAMVIGAQEVILIDKFKDFDGTLESSFHSLLYVRNHFPELKVMGVPQGKNMEEWLDCAYEMLDWGVDCIGVPKVLTNLCGRDARLHALMKLKPSLDAHKASGRTTEIHLLGCWESPLELTMIAKAEQQKLINPVRGCDSAIAFVYANAGLELNEDERPSGPVDFNAQNVDEKLLEANIELWNKSVSMTRDKVIKIW